jgi:hypothetical protein
MPQVPRSRNLRVNRTSKNQSRQQNSCGKCNTTATITESDLRRAHHALLLTTPYPGGPIVGCKTTAPFRRAYFAGGLLQPLPHVTRHKRGISFHDVPPPSSHPLVPIYALNWFRGARSTTVRLLTPRFVGKRKALLVG